MAVPDFQTLMRPVLRALSDGEPHNQQHMRDCVADELGVTPEERQLLIPSGRARQFSNRLAWSLLHMKHAELLTAEGRNSYRITPRGSQVLADHPERVDLKVLATFPEYVAFRNASKPKGEPPDQEATVTDELPPVDAMQRVLDAANESLAADLLSLVYAKPAAFLEQLALDLLKAMGYGGEEAWLEHTGKSGDRGLDGVVRQDALGLERIGVQAKRYDPDAAVPGRDVQAFAGALDEVSARQGVFVTTARFSKAAWDYAGRASKRLVLIDGQRLARLMVQYGVGVQVLDTFTLQRVDDDYFED